MEKIALFPSGPAPSLFIYPWCGKPATYPVPCLVSEQSHWLHMPSEYSAGFSYSSKVTLCDPSLTCRSHANALEKKTDGDYLLRKDSPLWYFSLSVLHCFLNTVIYFNMFLFQVICFTHFTSCSVNVGHWLDPMRNGGSPLLSGLAW